MEGQQCCPHAGVPSLTICVGIFEKEELLLNVLQVNDSVCFEVVVRSKSHGVTREGKLVQPSVKMERAPSDWGAEMVRVPWIEFLTHSFF